MSPASTGHAPAVRTSTTPEGRSSPVTMPLDADMTEDAVCASYECGFTMRECAGQYHLTTKAVRCILRRNGVPPRPRGRRVETPYREHDQITALPCEQATGEEIAEEFVLGLATVRVAGSHTPPDAGPAVHNGTMTVAASEITSLVRGLGGGEAAAGTVPVWLAIGGHLYQLGVCPEDAVRLREELSPVLARACRTRVTPGWLPGPETPAGRMVTGPMPKRDLILSVIRARITNGTYPAGSYLPTQRDLAGEHGMSVQPVRRACWELEDDGLIRAASRGRYVVEPIAATAAAARHASAAGLPGGCPRPDEDEGQHER